MEEDAKYFIGYDLGGEIMKIPIRIPSLVNKGEEAVINFQERLKSIVAFTQRFANIEAFLPLITTDNFFPSSEKIKLFKEENNEENGLKEIVELRGGLAFSNTTSWFDPSRIENYFFEHIENLEFLIAANDFFRKYFFPSHRISDNQLYGKILASEAEFLKKTPLYSTYTELEKYIRILAYQEKAKEEGKRAKNIVARDNALEKKQLSICRRGSKEMVISILYENNSKGDGVVNYEGLHDLALFVCGFEESHKLDKEKPKAYTYNNTGGRRVIVSSSDEYQGRLF